MFFPLIPDDSGDFKYFLPSPEKNAASDSMESPLPGNLQPAFSAATGFLRWLQSLHCSDFTHWFCEINQPINSKWFGQICIHTGKRFSLWKFLYLVGMRMWPAGGCGLSAQTSKTHFCSVRSSRVLIGPPRSLDRKEDTNVSGNGFCGHSLVNPFCTLKNGLLFLSLFSPHSVCTA